MIMDSITPSLGLSARRGSDSEARPGSQPDSAEAGMMEVGVRGRQPCIEVVRI